MVVPNESFGFGGTASMRAALEPKRRHTGCRRAPRVHGGTPWLQVCAVHIAWYGGPDVYQAAALTQSTRLSFEE